MSSASEAQDPGGGIEDLRSFAAVTVAVIAVALLLLTIKLLAGTAPASGGCAPPLARLAGAALPVAAWETLLFSLDLAFAARMLEQVPYLRYDYSALVFGYTSVWFLFGPPLALTVGAMFLIKGESAAMRKGWCAQPRVVAAACLPLPVLSLVAPVLLKLLPWRPERGADALSADGRGAEDQIPAQLLGMPYTLTRRLDGLQLLLQLFAILAAFRFATRPQWLLWAAALANGASMAYQLHAARSTRSRPPPPPRYVYTPSSPSSPWAAESAGGPREPRASLEWRLVQAALAASREERWSGARPSPPCTPASPSPPSSRPVSSRWPRCSPKRTPPAPRRRRGGWSWHSPQVSRLRSSLHSTPQRPSPP